MSGAKRIAGERQLTTRSVPAGSHTCRSSSCLLFLLETTAVLAVSLSWGLVQGLPTAPSEDELTSNDYHAWIFVAGSHGTVLKSSDAGS